MYGIMDDYPVQQTPQAFKIKNLAGWDSYPSAGKFVSSAGLKVFQREPTAFPRVNLRNPCGSLGEVICLEPVIQQVLGDPRVAAGGGLGQVED